MTSQVIDRLHAVSADKPALNHLPASLDASNLIEALGSLGVTVPAKITAAIANGEPLRASGHRFTVREIDGALSRTNLGIHDRMRLKAALDRNGILAK
jgi:hypothetical protein